MKLSKNFSLAELTKSQTALRKGIDNAPTQDEIEKLQLLVDNVLQPVREHFGRPVTINSGFRCLELNRAIGSKDNSQHRKGEAADIEIAGIANKELAEWIRDNLEFDQLILEFYSDKDPAAGWVHVSYVKTNRNATLTIAKDGTRVGLG